MTDRKQVLEQFQKDIAQHQMTVHQDDGVCRRLRFGRPGTSTYSFTIVTFPGYLVYVGDMGEYVFQRLPDMFEFFRGKEINPQYWAEKCVAAAGSGNGIYEFDEDQFATEINEHMDAGEWPQDVRDEVESEVLCYGNDEHRAMIAVLDFSSRMEGGPDRRYEFRDLFEQTPHCHTHRFLWCCYALQWAIATYDAAKAVPEGLAA